MVESFRQQYATEDARAGRKSTSAKEKAGKHPLNSTNSHGEITQEENTKKQNADEKEEVFVRCRMYLREGIFSP